ncbi:MAG: alpha-amylase family glycosyl hydrolase [Promethearchaeota archaeon]
MEKNQDSILAQSQHNHMFFQKHLSPAPPYFDSMNIGQGVLLQGFYWLCPEGNWWNTIAEYIPEFGEVGIDAIWLPAPYKAAGTTGISGMGYEPYDYYDLGAYDQKENIRTRFGTESELRSLISAAHTNNVGMVADIVVNHNNGGDLEFNPNVDDFTYTDFSNIASGRFPRNYTCFHPCEYETADEGVFANFPDLCHANPYVHDGLIEWGNWMYNDIGFDGWRFDNVVNFDPLFVRDWMNSVGGWGVAEYWHGDKNLIQDYIESTENTVSAFDFALIYRLEDMCDSGGDFNMMELDYVNKLIDINPDQAVTFVMNHDTERDEYSRVDYNRHLAYAFILTHAGYPSVFWPDYFNPWYHSHITNLIKIHNELSTGTMVTRWSDPDVYIAEDIGLADSPEFSGFIIALNDDPVENKTRAITTQWKNQLIYDLTNPYANPINVGESGKLEIDIPLNNYRIFSPVDLRSELVYAPWVIDHVNPYTIQKINQAAVNWSKLPFSISGEWGYPVFSDKFDDTRGRPQDLSYLYLMNDPDNLYIGFPYRENSWTDGGDLEFGIAISTKDGGTNWGLPAHEQLNFAGNTLPEFLIMASTDVDESPSNEIQSASLYSYSDESETWSTTWELTPEVDFKSSSTYKFATFRIPYEELALDQNNQLSVMIFSTQVGKPGAADSVPSDTTTDDYGDAETWLSMPKPINLELPPKSHETNVSDSDNFYRSIPGFNLILIVFSAFLGLMCIYIKKSLLI